MREFFHLSLWAKRREEETAVRAWDHSFEVFRARRLVLRRLSGDGRDAGREIEHEARRPGAEAPRAA